MNAEQYAERYKSLNWTIIHRNTEHDYEAPDRVAAIAEQAQILSAVYKIVEDKSKEIVDLRDGSNDVADYVGRSAFYISSDTAEIFEGVVTKNGNKYELKFESGQVTVGSILYLANRKGKKWIL